MKNVKNVKNEGLKLREFQILLRMLAGGKILEPKANYILMIPYDENGNTTGLPWSITDMKRYNESFVNGAKSADIVILEQVISEKAAGAKTKAKKLYKDEKYEELWTLLTGKTEHKNGELKGIVSGVALREYKRAYLRNNNPKNGQTNITTLSLLNVSELCLSLAKNANFVLAEERRFDSYTGNSNKTGSKGKVAEQIVEEVKKTSVQNTKTPVNKVVDERVK